jgi:release factor glutamine methyltransferase
LDANPASIGETLAAASHALEATSDSPRLDAQVLLADLLSVNRAYVLAHPEAALLPAQAKLYWERVERCRRGAALPHVLGWWEFFGLRFRVTPDVLIPRPETELLVERALEVVGRMSGRPRVVDVGTGSGCIAVTLAAQVPRLEVWGTDISRSALEVAQTNGAALAPGHTIAFIQADLLTPLPGPFDVVCANLPYIPTSQLGRLPVAAREPLLALDGGADGLSLIRRLVAQLPSALTRSGVALVEIEAEAGAATLAAARAAFPSALLKLEQDLTGTDRMLVIEAGG